MHLFCEGKEKKRRKSIEKFEREELFFGETKKRLLKKTQEGEPQTLEKEDQKRAKRAKSPSHILERTNHHRIMAPSKKGGKKESKTGAAVRVLDDDEEDKIQVLLLLLLVL